jgi:hypothetical protein
MFGKSGKPSDKSALNDRVRQLGGRKPAPPSYADPAPTPVRTPLRSETKRPLRHPQYKQGVVVIDGHQKVKVVIKDISVQGARIDYFIRCELPQHVVLQEATLKLNHRARVVWQDGTSAGLKFEA